MLRWQPMASMVTIVPLNSPRPLSLSTKSLPANVLDSALPADRAPQQNTSGDSPYPLLIHFLPSAYSNLYASPLGTISWNEGKGNRLGFTSSYYAFSSN